MSETKDELIVVVGEVGCSQTLQQIHADENDER